MPFDRLVRTVDQWAGRRGRRDVFAQIGLSDYRPAHLPWACLLEPAEFRRKLQAADVVVAHAGMGSILSALELGKPILVMPRRGDLRETRNDHQIATARRFLEQGLVAAAFSETELLDRLDEWQLWPNPPRSPRIASCASPQLLQTLHQFVIGGALPVPAEVESLDLVAAAAGGQEIASAGQEVMARSRA